MTRHFPIFGCLLASCLWILSPLEGLAAGSSIPLFGHQEQQNSGFEIFPLWTAVLQRNERESPQEKKCPDAACPTIDDWKHFLKSLADKSFAVRVNSINAYANRHRYVLDIDNYGVLDYWATARQLLVRDGDCEDYAITKYTSLRQIGVNPDLMRVVVVQDTNLRIAHAVLALYTANDILILDNQIPEVTSHRAITHYVPVYSINERHWWMHLP